jgi:hypothetical protein
MDIKSSRLMSNKFGVSPLFWAGAGVELRKDRRESIAKLRARRTAGQHDGYEQPALRPIGWRSACGDDPRDEIAATIQSLLGQKPFLLLFTTRLGAVAASTLQRLLKASTNQ